MNEQKNGSKLCKLGEMLCGKSCSRLGVATGAGWHWVGTGTIRTSINALGGLQAGYQ